MSKNKQIAFRAATLPSPLNVKKLLVDIRALIESARTQTARVVNSALAMHYWSVGRRIRQNILKQKRAEYGEKIVSTLGRQLSAVYGQG